MQSICRTCLREVSYNNFLALIEDIESLRVKTELSVCVPEIVVDLVTNPVVCFNCVNALHSAYEFKTQCLQTEERLKNYLKNPDGNCDYPVQKLEVLNLKPCITTENKIFINPLSNPTTDVIDDWSNPTTAVENVNNLLDEAPENAPQWCEIIEHKNIHVKCEDNFFEECVSEPYEINSSDDDKKPLIVQDNMTVKECFVTCTKLPDSVFNSNFQLTSLTQNIAWSKSKRNKNNQRGQDVFKCSECPYKTSKKRNLKLHKYNHIEAQPFLCDICKYCFTTKTCLRRHMMTHTGEKPFACGTCTYKCASKQNLERHSTIHTTKMHSDEKLIKQFACTMCPFKTAYKRSLKKHARRIHSDEDSFKLFACKICPFKSSNKHSLEKHSRIHDGEKYYADFSEKSVEPFACKMCSYKCVFEPNLKRHMRTVHSDEDSFKTFPCNMCPYKSAYKHGLERHIRRKHSESKLFQPFACNICSYKNAEKFMLARHIIQMHSGEKS